MENASLQSKELLIFCHGIINEHISGLKHIGLVYCSIHIVNCAFTDSPVG